MTPKMQYAVLWERTYLDGRRKRVDQLVYKSKAKALEAIDYWLSERAAGKFATYQNQIEPHLMSRPVPSNWKRVK